VISRSIYNLKIDTIYMYDIPFDRSFLQLSNGVRHVMPSTDRKLELTAKASMAQPDSQPAVCSNGLKEFYCISLFLEASIRIIHSNRPWQLSQHACNIQHGVMSATCYLLKWPKKGTYWYELWWHMLCPIITYQNSKCICLYISGDSRVTGKTSCLWDREP